MRKLTAKQAEILNEIIWYIEQWGYPPTYRELGARLGNKSHTTIRDHLRYIEKKGYLRLETEPRAITILQDTEGETVCVRVVRKAQKND